MWRSLKIPHLSPSEWPTKLYTISYILYPFIGSITTILIGTLSSLISRPFLAKPKDSCYDYLHPLVKRLCCVPESPVTTGTYKKNSYVTNGVGSIMKVKLTNVQRSAYTNRENGERRQRGIDNSAFEMKNIWILKKLFYCRTDTWILPIYHDISISIIFMRLIEKIK